MSEIKMYPIDQIYPHPHNPRRQLGDITELTDSVCALGILQNLTLIPGHWISETEWKPEGYTILIGHRRFAAAKAAGLTEVPADLKCDLTQSQQVSIMLLENIQREELTVIEQAQGFQMMLDLGENVESIAEKTGFSKSTIRHRINIAKLDQDMIKKHEEDGFQLSLSHFYELEKLPDIELRNKVLENIASASEIQWRVQNELRIIAQRKTADAIIEKLEPLGINAAPEDAAKELYSSKWMTVKTYDLDKGVPDEIVLPDDTELDSCFYLRNGWALRIIRLMTDITPVITPEKLRQEEIARRRSIIQEHLQAMAARRKQFILCYLNEKLDTTKESEELKDRLWRCGISLSRYISSYYMKVFLKEKDDSGDIDVCWSNLRVFEQLLLLVHTGMDDVGCTMDYNGNYQKSSALKLMSGYTVLSELGWSFEPGEEEILNGVHELYQIPEEIEE